MIGTIGRGAGVRSAARRQGRAVRRQQVQLDRQRQRRGQRLRGVERHTGITKFDDLLTKELVVGGTGAAADTDQFPQRDERRARHAR